MASETTNYKFVKPDLTDPADIRIINRNFDKLDDMIFRSGEIGNHLGDPNAHADIFAKYLPLEGGTLTGSLYGKYSEWSSNIKLGQGVIFPNDTTNSIVNGYGQKYGAKITLYGSDITSGYTDRKCCIRLESIDKTNTNQSSVVSITPNQVAISTNNSTSKYALNVPTIGVNRIYSINNNIPVINSYNGNCTMQFTDLGNNQYIRFTVKDHNIDIRDDGVYYNDMPSLYIVDTQITTGTLPRKYGEGTGNYYCRMTKYVTGLLIYELKTWSTNMAEYPRCSFTYPVPFVDDNYVVAGNSIRDDSSFDQHGDYINQTWRATTTGIELLAGGGNCHQGYIIRGRWK